MLDLNSDLGESFGRYQLGEDQTMLSLVTSANLACGVHAGDPEVMALAVRTAHQLGVHIGAHPSYPDRQGFGRRSMALSGTEIYHWTLYQLGALSAFLRPYGAYLHHLKPHGALYNDACRSAEIAEAVVRAARDFDPGLSIYGLPGSPLLGAAASYGLRGLAEVFADRALREDGQLVPRSEPGAVLHDPQAAGQAIAERLSRGLAVDTVCVHGDTPGAVQFTRQLRRALRQRGIQLARRRRP